MHTIKDLVSLPPEYFSKKIDEAMTELLRSKYERLMDRDLGIILVVYNIRDISDGFILPGDPNTHHYVTFDVLTFNLEPEEVVMGEVSEVTEFGCFVRIGPIDGLVHLSQITTDFMNYDRKAGMFVARSSGKTLKKGDTVFAKVSTVSIKNTIKDSKIALTMRPEGLGKLEWITETAAPAREKRRTAKKKG
ncbi:MAG: DNA-directed RNA polymerase [Candidatus Micrarchaeia archaeon]